jgi:hypothetical protein
MQSIHITTWQDIARGYRQVLEQVLNSKMTEDNTGRYHITSTGLHLTYKFRLQVPHSTNALHL